MDVARDLSLDCPMRGGARVLRLWIVKSCVVYPAVSISYSLFLSTKMLVKFVVEKGSLRSSIRIQEDMSFLQFLGIRALLKVFLERVLTDMVGGVDWRDGSLVDD